MGHVTFPLSATVCGLPAALSLSDSITACELTVCLVNIRVIVQSPPAAKVVGLVGQALAPVLVAAKSPEAANELIVKAAVPVFVSVTVIGVLVVVSGWLPKSRLVGRNAAPASVLLPLSATVCGLPPELSESNSVPVRAPKAVGVKVTLMVLFPPAANAVRFTVYLHDALPISAKSPEAANELIVKAAVPVFVSVTVIGALVVVSSWLPKSRLVGANPTPGPVPFPLSATVCGLPAALSPSDSVPVRAPKAVGVKVTLMVQFPPAAKVVGRGGQALAPVIVAAKMPDAANELIVKAAVPVFVSVTVIGVLVVVSSWLPKPRLVGANTAS